jgi:membrane associated rhomboid family serine protease
MPVDGPENPPHWRVSGGRLPKRHAPAPAPDGCPVSARRTAESAHVFPLHDDNPTELFPLLTLALLGACVMAWWYLQGAGLSEAALTDSVCALGAIPAEVTGRVGGGPEPCALGGLTWQALFSSMFLHGSWMHLIGNMWFLWIFGNNVEDSMGHLRFLLFYLIAGVAAAGAHIFTDPASTIPMVGASGAISGVMGAYLVLYPKARIDTLFFFVFFIRVVPLPAWVLLGYWMVLQIGGSFATTVAGGGGVAYGAHVGGFLAGLLLVVPFRNRKLVDAKRRGVVLAPQEIDHRGWW